MNESDGVPFEIEVIQRSEMIPTCISLCLQLI